MSSPVGAVPHPARSYDRAALSQNDYDELRYRLIALLDGRLAASFSIDYLVTHMTFLDLAVDDFNAATAELREALSARSLYMASYDDLAEAYEASVESGEQDAFRAIAVRFHYRLDCAYAAARRVLDRVVVVANELLPRPHGTTDLKKSHNGFRPLLVSRCAELGLDVPTGLLDQIDDLHRRIKTTRDQIEHVKYPKSLRSVQQVDDELIVEWRTIVPTDETPMTIRFEPAGVLRDAIYDYVLAMVDLLEAGRRA